MLVLCPCSNKCIKFVSDIAVFVLKRDVKPTGQMHKVVIGQDVTERCQWPVFWEWTSSRDASGLCSGSGRRSALTAGSQVNSDVLCCAQDVDGARGRSDSPQQYVLFTTLSSSLSLSLSLSVCLSVCLSVSVCLSLHMVQLIPLPPHHLLLQ